MAKNGTTTVEASTEPKKTRGEGPVVVAYLDSEGKASKRVSDKTTAIRVSGKEDGSQTDFSLSDVPASIVNQLLANAVAKRVDTSIRNGIKVEGATVSDLASKIFATIKSGVINTKKEGGGKGAGRQYDPSFDLAVMEAYMQAKLKRAPTPKELEVYETKLTSFTPAERKAHIAKNMNDAQYKVTRKKAEAARLAQQMKSGKVESTDDAMAEILG